MYEETIAGMRKIVQDYKGRLTPYMRFTIAEAANAIEEQSVIIESYRNRMKAGCDWIPVTERLPDDGLWVMVWGQNWAMPIMAFHESGAWIDDQFEPHTVTHWLPLPAPPKED